MLQMSNVSSAPDVKVEECYFKAVTPPTMLIHKQLPKGEGPIAGLSVIVSEMMGARRAGEVSPFVSSQESQPIRTVNNS